MNGPGTQGMIAKLANHLIKEVTVFDPLSVAAGVTLGMRLALNHPEWVAAFFHDMYSTESGGIAGALIVSSTDMMADRVVEAIPVSHHDEVEW